MRKVGAHDVLVLYNTVDGIFFISGSLNLNPSRLSPFALLCFIGALTEIQKVSHPTAPAHYLSYDHFYLAQGL
jgi:hypothetical protein